ncbi:alpha/beta fold hydrolase [Hoeflea olei]|uniref:Pimeloyl-ACP methyl ester esterase n=1 Tax=Hoeflea olei TaxID=1480615 RepID=A0A1C1YTE5_9HYPH|nr:pimeloyl-ACP methyl ester esterase [Hoeflea olei]OCW56798.1 pimeloyl-ACP methyl ester esterase [Hoeflea olei]
MKIVILPGLDGTGKLLSEARARLEPKHVVSVIQYPPHLYRYEDLQVWVENLLPEDDFIIVAESFSGPLAVMLSDKKPRGLKGVVFVATFAKTPVKLPSNWTYALEIIPLKSRLITWLAQPLLMGKWSEREFTAKFAHAMQLVPASTIAGRLREVLKVDVAEKIGRLPIPFIYLSATRDRLVPSRMALDFALAPDVIFEIDGPHFLLQANPSQSAAHVLSFAARVS